MRILIFGDSITQGFWDVDGGWVSRLRKAYDQKTIAHDDYDLPSIFNLGVSGDTSDDVLARFDNEVKARAKQELEFIIAVGVNDSRTISGVNYSTIDRYTQNLSNILTLAKQYSTRILFVGLTPCVETRSNPVSWGDSGYTNDRIKVFNTALHEFCHENSVGFIEILEPFSIAASKSELLPDGLHPNEAGHQLISNLVEKHLQNFYDS